MWKYIGKAFTNSWNLLLFFGGLGFAALSGHPDVAVPFVLAGEAAYLGFLGTHPRFQRAVDAQDARRGDRASSQRNREMLQRILESLPPAAYGRYERLRGRCRELQQIAADLKTPGESPPIDLDSVQAASLDRLLWVYLRLLFTQHSLERFLDAVSSEKLEAELQRLEAQRGRLDDQDSSPHAVKIRRTLEDNLGTVRERIANVRQAESNHQFVQLELDRLENKIQSLAELAVNRQDPNFISSQVDAVAESMRETERTINDLQAVTGLGPSDDAIPDLLESPPVMIR